MIELLSGELHLVPWEQQLPRHEHSRQCWCDPWCDDGVWVHQDGSRRPGKPQGATLLAGGAGVPGDG